eukprot:scaffold434_cov186-Pinguiococcus_pyrenoidosus.AAC.30
MAPACDMPKAKGPPGPTSMEDRLEGLLTDDGRNADDHAADPHPHGHTEAQSVEDAQGYPDLQRFSKRHRVERKRRRDGDKGKAPDQVAH